MKKSNDVFIEKNDYVFSDYEFQTKLVNLIQTQFN